MTLIEELKRARGRYPASKEYHPHARYDLGCSNGLEEAIDVVRDYKAWLDTEIENEIYQNEGKEDDFKKGYVEGLKKALDVLKEIGE